MSELLCRPTLEEALRLSVAALGGMQAVGHNLWPTKDPILAGQRLAHCLDDDYRDKLALDEVLYIFGAAKRAGRHAGFENFAHLCGYHVVAVIDPKDEIADLVHRAEACLREGTELSAKALAYAHATHLKVGGE